MKRVLGAMAITAGVLVGMSACLPFWAEDEHLTVSYGVAEPVRELVVEGTDGGVRLQVPAGEAYTVDARASEGGVEVGVPSREGAAHSITARATAGGVTVSGV
ncbi:hypothetical protein ACFRAR_23040 [Kitasatospora sp. NPDC056651]|uniref:hypothetical protein n=1 Tax=Kitasatospora sp. NPDC056651 TaxID=3345892 RepID=UPI00369A8D5B